LAAFRVSGRRKLSEALARVAKGMSEMSPTHGMRNEEREPSQTFESEGS
jgi:hypothetical protein